MQKRERTNDSCLLLHQLSPHRQCAALVESWQLLRMGLVVCRRRNLKRESSGAVNLIYDPKSTASYRSSDVQVAKVKVTYRNPSKYNLSASLRTHVSHVYLSFL